MKILIIAGMMIASVTLHAQQSMEQLRAKMDRAAGGNKAKVALQIAAMQVEQANTEFEAGQSDKAHALVREATGLVELAGDASLSANKKVKDTEISVRKLERRLKEIYRSVSFDDQDELDKSLKAISVVRNRLLDRMFGLDKKDRKK